MKLGEVHTRASIIGIIKAHLSSFYNYIFRKSICANEVFWKILRYLISYYLSCVHYFYLSKRSLKDDNWLIQFL